MSIFEKQSQEVIRKAKYRVKNSDGKYEIVYLETSADQVETTDEMQFISAVEKAQITTNKSAIEAETQARTEAVEAINGRLGVLEGEEGVDGSVKKALKDAKDYTDVKIGEVNSASEELAGKVTALETAVGEGTVDSRIEAAKTELQGNIDSLSEQVSTNTSDISDLKDALANKNSNTIVVNTEAEITTANSDPKVGDLAYVINSKRAYIYKGVTALAAAEVPAGWVVFDEITNELDLVDYLKKDEAASTYRRLDVKIAETELDEALTSKLNDKADKSYVDGEISTTKEFATAEAKREAEVVDGKLTTAKSELEESISTVDGKVTANTEAIAQEVSDRQGEITRVEGLVSSETEARTEAIENVKKDITNRIDKFAPVVQSDEPVGTEAGHVWLETSLV